MCFGGSKGVQILSDSSENFKKSITFLGWIFLFVNLLLSMLSNPYICLLKLGIMKKENRKKEIGRRNFFKVIAASGLGAALLPISSKVGFAAQEPQPDKPETNINDALAFPRNTNSMPGKHPGMVVKVFDENSYAERKINYDITYGMISEGIIALTGASTLEEAWKQFVKPGERIGLKLNPIGGTLLSTSHEVVKSVKIGRAHV